MGKFSKVYFKNENKYISIKEYKIENHHKKLFCPNCKEAPMHIVEKQKTTYFAANRKNQHAKKCPYFSELNNRNHAKIINNSKIERLVESEKPKDREKLKFLIENSFNYCKRELNDSKTAPIYKNTSNKKLQNNLSDDQNKASSKHNNHIKIVHIKNIIKEKDEWVNQHFTIYGEADICFSYTKNEKNKNGEEYSYIRIAFKAQQSVVFSIFLTGRMLEYFKKSSYFGTKEKSLKFIVFGKLSRKDRYLNLRIKTTEHLMLL